MYYLGTQTPTQPVLAALAYDTSRLRKMCFLAIPCFMAVACPA